MVALLLGPFGQHIGVQLALAFRIYTSAALPPGDALAHVQAATSAATDEVSAELLLAVAYVESRYDSTWVSRVENRKRITARYQANTPPKRLDKGTTLYCGPLQTRSLTWAQCQVVRGDRHAAYRAGAAELTSWLRDRRVRGDMKRALAGYGCGNHGVRTGKCNRYPERVLFRARRFGYSAGRARARS